MVRNESSTIVWLLTIPAGTPTATLRRATLRPCATSNTERQTRSSVALVFLR